MSLPNVVPTLANFGGGQCKALRERWWIQKRALVSRAGVTEMGLVRFEKGTAPPGWQGKGAVYDALLDLVLEQSRFATRQIEAAIKVHRGA